MAQTQGEPLKVVATTIQAADLVKLLAGELVGTEVLLTALMGARG